MSVERQVNPIIKQLEARQVEVLENAWRGDGALTAVGKGGI